MLTHWKNYFGPNPLGFEDAKRTGKDGFYLYQNTPNPFLGSTTIQYELPNAGNVELSIYNLNGQKVKTLINQNMIVIIGDPSEEKMESSGKEEKERVNAVTRSAIEFESEKNKQA